METIEITPTWSAVLPILLAAIENGTDHGRRMAREELARMAQAADKYNEVRHVLREAHKVLSGTDIDTRTKLDALCG